MRKDRLSKPPAQIPNSSPSFWLTTAELGKLLAGETVTLTIHLGIVGINGAAIHSISLADGILMVAGCSGVILSAFTLLGLDIDGDQIGLLAEHYSTPARDRPLIKNPPKPMSHEEIEAFLDSLE